LCRDAAAADAAQPVRLTWVNLKPSVRRVGTTAYPSAAEEWVQRDETSVSAMCRIKPDPDDLS